MLVSEECGAFLFPFTLATIGSATDVCSDGSLVLCGMQEESDEDEGSPDFYGGGPGLPATAGSGIKRSAPGEAGASSSKGTPVEAPDM